MIRHPLRWWRRWRTSWLVRRHALPDEQWLAATRDLVLLRGLDAREKARLRVLATLLIHRKTFVGAGGLALDLTMKIVIAAQACVEILAFEHGIRAFDGWYEVIVYPDTFVVDREEMDAAGVVHAGRRALSGEAWRRGPVILSWADVERDSFRLHPGHNVVIHEFAHKLDMLNGRADGFPPLHPDMPIEVWSRSLSEAYEDLIERTAHHHGAINPYATTDPAEFFAVICEYFFTAPQLLHEAYPHVYEQLSAYFRQDPLARLCHSCDSPARDGLTH